jgi:succinate dehydrogenase/fumarate reductase flavoprotein subunit
MGTVRATKWDLEADVVVAGSGGAGLTAAILAHDQDAQVVILEASDKVGGTTAVSGGYLWIPLNHHMAKAGIQDSREEALTYAKSQTLGKAADDLVETVIDTGPQLVRYLEAHTPVRFKPHTPVPDYQMHLPGAKIGRELAPELFSKKELGEWESRLRPGWGYDLPIPGSDFSEVSPLLTPQALPWDAIGELMEKGMTGGGNALAAALFKGCLNRNISTLIQTRVRELIREDGRVVGLRAERNGKDFLVKARGGVVLASGGFEWNEDLKRKFLPGPLTHPATPPSLQGDGLIMAMEVGADLGNMSEIWGSPTVTVPGEEYDGRQLNRLCMSERCGPHTILVNRYGERFVNEACNYNDMCKAFNYFDPNAFDFRNIPAWAILDSQYREKYALLTLMPGDPDPDWLAVDQTLAGVARKVGVDPHGLQATVARFNGLVREGKDRDFLRGESALDRWYGDPKASHPNLGTVEKPPFYALPVYPGSLGTKGGPRTNTRGQVLNVRGQVIPGLYAAGNVMAGASGPSYWGAGTTISLALIWGYICGINAAKEAKGAKA